jgi:uncharacterized protein YjiS (DUF1127 family)
MFLHLRADETIFPFREAIYPQDENRRQWTTRIYSSFNRWIQPKCWFRQNEMESVMTETFRRWRSDRRYRSILRALRSLSAQQLGELGIRPFEIQRLAREAARKF